MNDVCGIANQGGVSVDSHGKGAGKGALVKWEHAPCIAAAQDTTLFVFSDSSTSWEGSRGARSRADSSRPPLQEGGLR